MISTSSEYQASIAQRTKRKTYAKLEVDFTDPFLDESISVSVSGEGNAGFKDQTADGVEDPTENWIALDGTWLLDGSFKLMPPKTSALEENLYETGWWSADASDGSANFTTPQTLTVEFSARSIENLKVIGDSAKGEYPVDFTIKLYDASSSLLHTETVTANTNVYWYATISTVAAVTKSVLSITKWSHAGRCAKIVEFFSSIRRTYEGQDIFDIELLEEREVENASLPIGNISSNQLTLKLNNAQRLFDAGNVSSALHGLVKPNRKITAYIGAAGAAGATEWIPLGVFWTQDWDVPDFDIYAGTAALDLLNLMGLATYSPGLLTNSTLYQIIEDCCIDFGLSSSEYWIDSELSAITIPYAYVDSISHRECIRQACAAAVATAFVDRNGVLRIEGQRYLRDNSTSSVRTISASEYFTRKNPSKYQRVRNVINVTTQPLVPDSTASEVYSDDSLSIPIGGLSVTVFFSEKPVVNAVAALTTPPAGVSISSATYYSWGADITIGNTSGSAQTVALTVDAKILRVTGSRRIQARSEASIAEFGELAYDLEDNPFVQTKELAQTIANALISTYSNAKRDLSQEWRGDPALELSDRITTDDSRTTQADFWLIRQQIRWDGTLSVQHEAIAATDVFYRITEDGYARITADGRRRITE